MNASEADALLKGARRLDRVVLNQVFDIFYPKIFSYVIFRIGDHHLSAQICGQVFTELLDSLSKRREPTQNLAGWLFHTAGSLVQDHLDRIVFEPASGDIEPVFTAEDSLPASTAPGMIGYRLQAVFQRLTPEHQHLLALRFSSRHSIDDLSHILGRPPRIVKDMQYQALRALRQALQARIR